MEQQNHFRQKSDPAYEAPECVKETELALLSKAIEEINGTLKDVKDLLISSAVLQEQNVELRKSFETISDNLHSLEIHYAETTGSSKWIEKVIWAVIGAGLSFLFVTGKL